jgi:hypothetical protein
LLFDKKRRLNSLFPDKTLDVSDHSSAVEVWVYEKLKGAGVNDTAAFVIGGVAFVAAIPSTIGYGAANKIPAGSDSGRSSSESLSRRQ